jgi:hypothetical protein
MLALAGDQPTYLYFISLAAIVAGLVLYNVRLPSSPGALAVDDDVVSPREPTEMDDVAAPPAYAQVATEAAARLSA